MIEEVFGAAGLLAGKFPGYAPRKGQIDMAVAVESAIAKKRHLVVEGPTGTGKSLAYLVPAIAHAALPLEGQQPGKVIVVTANIGLQEQLIQKDLPLLRDVLGFPFSFAIAKGKNNYLCVDALGKTLAETSLMAGGQGTQLERLLEWAKATRTGDVSEFSEIPAPGLWKRMSTTSDECKGSSCKQYQQCFAEKAKLEVSLANVVVTNYHLFFAHLIVRAKMREIRDRGGAVELDVVLPPASVVIFDEAHKAADIARDFLGFTISKGGIEWLVRGFNHELADQTRAAAGRFFDQLFAHKKSRSYKSRLKKGHPVQGEELAALLDRVSKFYKDAAGAGAWDADQRAEFEVRIRRGATLAAQVRQAMKPEDHDEAVFFVEETDRGAPVLKSKPIDVSGWMKDELFAQYGTVVMTSATLATGPAGFSFVKKEVGLADAEELVAESPFSWKDQVLLVVPKTMCMPDERDRFPGAVADHVREACEAARGRTLALFTSYKNLQLAYDGLGGFEQTVFKQGDAPRVKLVQKFRDDVGSVLLGVESFWAGVDVPGESLSCVVIDRLPFPTPDDPIVDALSARDDRWFFNYAVPRAIIQFKQGFGRLIRTTKDRGCVVILDRRIREKAYGRSFLAALPSVMMSDSVGDVRRFLDQEPK